MQMTILLKRVYEVANKDDGFSQEVSAKILQTLTFG